jgi:acyl-CoA hydrolase
MKTIHFQTSSFTVFPTDLNYGNTLFGGKMMAEIDCEAAKVARSVLYGTGADNAVTKTFNTEFLNPAKQSDLVVMEADVVTLGTTSITIQVDAYVWAGPDRKNWKKICSVQTVFVALKDGQKFAHGQTMDKVVVANRAAAAAIQAFKEAKYGNADADTLTANVRESFQ